MGCGYAPCIVRHDDFCNHSMPLGFIVLDLCR